MVIGGFLANNVTLQLIVLMGIVLKVEEMSTAIPP